MALTLVKVARLVADVKTGKKKKELAIRTRRRNFLHIVQLRPKGLTDGIKGKPQIRSFDAPIIEEIIAI